MPRRLQIRIETADAASAEDVRAALQQAIAGADLSDQAVGVLLSGSAAGVHIAFLDIRARQGRAAADAIRAAVRAQIRASGRLAAAERVLITGHECSHGTGDPRPCVEDEAEEIAGPAAGKRRAP